MATIRTTKLSVRSSLFEWMELLIIRKRQLGKDATADLYRATCNWLRKYLGSREIPVRRIDRVLVEDFFGYLRRTNRLRTNTINSYMSAFRSMYNQIIRETTYKPSAFPFEHLVIRLEKTVKRAVHIEALERLLNQDLRQTPDLDLAADLCSFSFLACGIPVVDLVHLTKRNIEGDMLVYHRAKTNTLIRIELTSGMRLLLDKYASSDSPYLFPVLPNNGEVCYEKYKSLLRKYNRSLKILGKRAGISVPMTSYVIRHTWASEAYRCFIPVSLIGQALGHTSEKTTHYYLKQLDTHELGKANAIVSVKIDRQIQRKMIPLITI